MISDLHQAAEAIANSQCLLITAGAGMSVDSGLPDYRGKEGFWNHFPLYRSLGVDYAAMTRPSAFERDPHFAWGFYGHCLSLYRKAQPHAGYCSLLTMAPRFGERFFVLTTNVDGFFLRAGFDDTRLRECHGSLHRLQCVHPCERMTWSADSFHPQVDLATMRLQEPLPRCPRCNSVARPAVFAFGDTHYVWESTQAQTDRYQAWKEKTQGLRLVVIECGAGPTVPGLRREGEAMARSHTGSLLRINLSDAEVAHPDDMSLPGTAMTTLQAIAKLLST